MKKLKFVVIFCAMITCLCACGTQPREDTVSELDSQVVSKPVESEVSSKETDDTESLVSQEEKESSPPKAVHSALYVDGYTQDQVISYFNEVVLDTEYATGVGDFTLVQKWEDPIRYRIYGEPTQQDLLKLETLFAELNKVEGFPGVFLAEDGEAENLSIYFQGYDAFYEKFGEFINYEESDGAVQYWYYDSSNCIYEASIGYLMDTAQSTRLSVIPEEVVNGLGISDTVLREDSITYQYASDAVELSEIDWLLVKLLYHPDIKAGMDRETCEQVIRSLYY